MDTEKIISDSIASLPGSAASMGTDPGEPDTVSADTADTSETAADTTADTTASTSATAEETAAPETTVNQKTEQEPADELLTNEFKGNKNNRMPYNRVRAVVDNAVKKATEPLTAQIEQYKTQHAEYEAQLTGMRLIDDEPEKFLQALSEADPRYAKLLSKQPETAAPAQRAQVPSDKPKPDIPLDDGRWVYSAEAQEALAEWTAQQRIAELEQRYSEQFGPLLSQHRAEAHVRQALPKVRAQIAAAEQWDGFTENKQAIHDVMAKNPALTLQDAYIQVVTPKLRGNRDEMRKSLLEEIKKKPAAASAPAATGGTPPVKTGPRSTEDIIRDSIASLKNR